MGGMSKAIKGEQKEFWVMVQLSILVMVVITHGHPYDKTAHSYPSKPDCLCASTCIHTCMDKCLHN